MTTCVSYGWQATRRLSTIAAKPRRWTAEPSRRRVPTVALAKVGPLSANELRLASHPSFACQATAAHRSAKRDKSRASIWAFSTGSLKSAYVQSLHFTSASGPLLRSLPSRPASDRSAVEPEHILLGVLDEGKGLGSRILARTGGALDGFRSDIVRRLTRRETISESDDIPFSAACERVLRYAGRRNRSAVARCHRYRTPVTRAAARGAQRRGRSAGGKRTKDRSGT